MRSLYGETLQKNIFHSL